MTRFTLFLGTVLQIVPTTVIVVTDSVPTWARCTLAAWLALWATVTVAKSSAPAQ